MEEAEALLRVERLRRRQMEQVACVVAEEQLAEEERQARMAALRAAGARRSLEQEHARARRKAEGRIRQLLLEHEVTVARRLAEVGLLR